MISIIVPVYNVSTYLSFCIESILKQDSANWELILVNDGSTDISEEICRYYVSTDQRIKLITKDNGGLSSARNVGLKHVCGEWVIFVDGDDYLSHNTISELERLISYLPKNVSLVQYGYSEVSQYNQNQADDYIGDMEIVSDKREMFNKLLYIGGEAASACTKLIRVKNIDGLRFKEGIIHEDEDFTTRLLIATNSVCYCDFKPYMYVRRPNSIITSRFTPKRLSIISIMNNRIELLTNIGLDDVANKFRLKLIRSLWIMYMAASSSKEIASCKRILKEISFQLNSLKTDDSISKFERLKYSLVKKGAPIMQLENIVRSITNKRVRYE